MREILVNYEPVNPTTWAYLASLLMIAVYFKFNRVFSVRNADLLGLISLAPALLMIQYARQHAASMPVEHAGYIWLFAVSGLFMLRLLLDALMVRRPLLEPNLTVGGLAFLGCSLFLFLMANVVTGTPDAADVSGAQRAADLAGGKAPVDELNSLRTHGPGFPLIYLLPHISTQSVLGENGQQAAPTAPAPAAPPDIEGDTSANPSESDTSAAANRTDASEAATDSEPQPASPPAPQSAAPVAPVASLSDVVTARVMAILSQLAIVIGLVIVGVRHFDNIKTGIAVATLYLLLPYTAMWTGSVTHALPGALLVWAIVFYRWPLFSGAMIGLAFGSIYYPVFLLPLWISFYWQRGLTRFIVGVLAMIGLVVAADAFMAENTPAFLAHLRQMFGLALPQMTDLSGAWGDFWRPIYRFPIIAAHVCLSLSMALWPAHKNLGTLVAYSAALMLGTQFWHAHSGGLALAWYLPLLLLTTFRPNLEDRVAAAVVR